MATGEIPEIGSTAVTAKALDIGKAWALPSAPVAVAPLSGWTMLGVCAQLVAGTSYDRQDEDSNQEEPEQPNPTCQSLL